MSSHYRTFLVRKKNGHPLETVEILEHAAIFGITGFAFHRLDGDRSMWRLSHTETGAMVGKGSTKELAMEDALRKARDAGGLREGIERMREIVGRVEA